MSKAASWANLIFERLLKYKGSRIHLSAHNPFEIAIMLDKTLDAATEYDSIQIGMTCQSEPALSAGFSNLRRKPPEYISGRSLTLKTDLKPMPR